jgi:N-acetylglucosamine-6-phosphate deacetylase
MKYINSIFFKVLAFFLATSITAGCGSRGDADSEGYKLLETARMKFAQGDFAGARATVDSLRTNCPTAFNAREEAIILLDSVELADALQMQSDVDEKLQTNKCDSLTILKEDAKVKEKFYRKKLAHDIKNLQKH